jgi:hypothetical protein
MGRVTRKNNRRRNAHGVTVRDWLICGALPLGECKNPKHDREMARLLAEFQLFGPWDGVRELPGCGCEFVAVPGVTLR